MDHIFLDTQINSTTADSYSKSGPSITALDGGGFVATWDSGDFSDSEVYARRYDSNATENSIEAYFIMYVAKVIRATVRLDLVQIFAVPNCFPITDLALRSSFIIVIIDPAWEFFNAVSPGTLISFIDNSVG